MNRRNVAERAVTTTSGGSEPDYSVFFRREYATVARMVNLVVHDQGRAEELAQEAFIQLLRHWRRVSSYDNPEAWVRRVAVRLAIKHAKREHRRRTLERQSVSGVSSQETGFSLDETLRELSARQRAAIVLHYYEGQPIEQIALMMGCSQNTVKSHLHRGRSRLRDLLTQPGGGLDVAR
jgi:RNA polymerase sigma-70 factor, ECF subfamily